MFTCVTHVNFLVFRMREYKRDTGVENHLAAITRKTWVVALFKVFLWNMRILLVHITLSKWLVKPICLLLLNNTYVTFMLVYCASAMRL